MGGGENIMKRSVYKIYIAGAIVSLFLLSSITAAGLATTSGRLEKSKLTPVNPTTPQTEDSQHLSTKELQIVKKQSHVLPEQNQELPSVVYWDGVGDLNYEWDGDGQDGGQYYGETYAIPEEWDIEETVPDESLPIPAPENILSWWKPQYICTAVLVKRAGLTAKFKAIVRNIGLPSIQPLMIRVGIWKILPLPGSTEIKLGILGGFGIGWRRVITGSYPWGLYGGTVVVWTDWGNQVDEYLDSANLLPRIRRFVSNSIPGASTSLRWWVPWNW